MRNSAGDFIRNHKQAAGAAVLFLLACALVVTAYGAALAQNEIKVGVVLPTTGREGKPGTYQKEGIELAMKQINDAGGVQVGNKKLHFKEVFYDDGSDSARSAQLVERAITSDGVTALISGYSSELGEAESVMPERYQTPWITPGAGTSAIFARGYQYAFGGQTSIDVLGFTTAEFLGSLVDQGNLKRGLKIAMALENTDHGIDYGKGVEQWIKQYPGYFTVVFSEKFELGGTDFSGLLQKIKQSHADIFLADTHLQDFITMQRQYLQSGMKHQLISYGARGPEADARKALGDGVDYILAGIWWSDELPYPQVKKFVADYQAFTGHKVDSWYAATAYEAVRALAAAITAAGTLDKAAIRDNLRKLQMKDSLVPGQVLKFGSNGQAGYPFLIVQNKPGGKVDIVYPKDAATGEAIAPMPAGKK
jgi:branched-chain amino acid transport system substrate-binding protein